MKNEVLHSYARHAAVAIGVVAADALKSGETDLILVGLAIAIAVVGPAIRAINPKDPAFGRIADAIDVELKALAKKAAKKKK